MPDGYRTIDQIDFNDLYYGGAGIRAAIDLYQQVELPVIPALAIQWNAEQMLKYAIGEKNGFQVLGFGELPTKKQVKMGAVYPTVTKYGYAAGTDRDTLLMSTGREIMLDMGRAMKEDPENVFARMLEKLMTNPGTNNAGYGLYNGQYATEENLTAPPKYQQNTFAASHSHYLWSATAGTLALSDIVAMKATIKHHGNKGNLVGFLNSAAVADLENAASWQGTSIIRSPVSDMVAIEGFSNTFALNGITFHETEMMPDDYVLVCEAGQPEFGRLLAFFEPTNIKGLQFHPGPSGQYPIIDSYWDRWFGLKVINRGGAAALYYATGHANAYTSPTFS